MTTQILTGNIGNTPELLRFESGKVKAVFSIATDSRDANGNKTTVWHRVSLWGKRAERAANLLHKGAKVLVHGEASQRPYTSREGVEKVSVEFAAQNFYLLAKPVKAQA